MAQSVIPRGPVNTFQGGTTLNDIKNELVKNRRHQTETNDGIKKINGSIESITEVVEIFFESVAKGAAHTKKHDGRAELRDKEEKREKKKKTAPSNKKSGLGALGVGAGIGAIIGKINGIPAKALALAIAGGSLLGGVAIGGLIVTFGQKFLHSTISTILEDFDIDAATAEMVGSVAGPAVAATVGTSMVFGLKRGLYAGIMTAALTGIEGALGDGSLTFTVPGTDLEIDATNPLISSALGMLAIPALLKMGKTILPALVTTAWSGMTGILSGVAGIVTGGLAKVATLIPTMITATGSVMTGIRNAAMVGRLGLPALAIAAAATAAYAVFDYFRDSKEWRDRIAAEIEATLADPVAMANINTAVSDTSTDTGIATGENQSTGVVRDNEIVARVVTAAANQGVSVAELSSAEIANLTKTATVEAAMRLGETLFATGGDVRALDTIRSMDISEADAINLNNTLRSAKVMSDAGNIQAQTFLANAGREIEDMRSQLSEAGGSHPILESVVSTFDDINRRLIPAQNQRKMLIDELQFNDGAPTINIISAPTIDASTSSSSRTILNQSGMLSSQHGLIQ